MEDTEVQPLIDLVKTLQNESDFNLFTLLAVRDLLIMVEPLLEKSKINWKIQAVNKYVLRRIEIALSADSAFTEEFMSYKEEKTKELEEFLKNHRLNKAVLVVPK